MKKLLIASALLMGLMPQVHAQSQTATIQQSLYSDASVDWQTTPCPAEIQGMPLSFDDNGGYVPRLKACTQTFFSAQGDQGGTFDADIVADGKDNATKVYACILTISGTARVPLCSDGVPLEKGTTAHLTFAMPHPAADAQMFTVNVVTDALRAPLMNNPVWSSAAPARHLPGENNVLSASIAGQAPTQVNTVPPNLDLLVGTLIPTSWQSRWCSTLRTDTEANAIPLRLTRCLQYPYAPAATDSELTITGSGTDLNKVLFGFPNNVGYVTAVSAPVSNKATLFTDTLGVRRLLLAIPFGANIESLRVLLQELTQVGISDPIPVPVQPAPAETPAVTTSDSEKQAFVASGIMEGRHVILRMTPETAAMLNNPKLFVEKLDRVYEFYTDLVGGTPYGGEKIKIDERCSGANPPPASQCPFGNMVIYDTAGRGDYWGLSGNPVNILSSGMKDTVRLFNEQRAVPLGIAHEFGHDFDAVSSKPQYMFHSASVEAWANMKAMYAIDAAGLPLELGGKIYHTSQEFIDGFYRPFLQQYQDQQLNFESLLSEAPVVGSLSDYYVSILLKLMDTTGKDALFDTIKFYKNNEDSLRTIGNQTLDDKYARFGQFLLIWSCKSGTDLSALLTPYRFTVPASTSAAIQSCLQTPSGQRTDQFILSTDQTFAAGNQ